MNVLFYGKDIGECLNAAEFELGIKKENLNYKVIKKSGIFNKKTAIEVKYELDFEKEKNKPEEEIVQKKITEDEDLLKIIDEVGSGIVVKNGNIKIMSNSLEEKGFTIRSCRGIDLYINDVKCKRGIAYNVTQYDNLRYVEEKTEAIKNFQFRISEDKMEVYAKIVYKPAYVYKLIDRKVTKEMILKSKKVPAEDVEKYKVNDIVEELKSNKIINGVLYDKIYELCESGSEDETLIVQGVKPEDDIPDEIKLYFDLEEKIVLDQENEDEKVDYKNIKSISNVEAGKVIAEKIPGKNGKNGIDIYGHEVKRQIARNKPIKAGNGCRIDNNKIIAIKEGRPNMKSGVFSINSTYTVNNVDIKSGNVKFTGDVEVNGTIEEGMEVFCHGMLLVHKDITLAKAKANGSVMARNIIQSNVVAGGYDAEKSAYVECLNNFYEEMEALITTIERMAERAPNRKIAELFKILVEQRYKKIPKLALEVITYNLTFGIRESEILDFIRNKIVGINAFRIVAISELYEFKNIIMEEIDYLGGECEVPSDIKAYYLQNSNIVCTGNILITGPGSYLSTLRASDKIEFTDVDSVVRGGTLIAKKQLKLKNVGSEAGIITKLKVDENGTIEAETIHTGTILIFGKKKKMLTRSGRKMLAYVNKDKEIQVDMLKLEY